MHLYSCPVLILDELTDSRIIHLEGPWDMGPFVSYVQVGAEEKVFSLLKSL